MPEEPVSCRETLVRTTRNVLRSATSETPLLRLLDTARQATDAVHPLPGATELACAAGCAFCCHHPVDMTIPEALAIAAYLRAERSPSELAATHHRIATQADQLQGLSYETHAQAKMPCALLVDGVCSVYPVRPFGCRAWNSTSVARCEDIHTHGDPVTMIPPLDMTVYEAVWEVARGVAQGVKQSRLDGASYELHSVLRRALDTPDATERWLRGETVFAGCTVGAFSE